MQLKYFLTTVYSITLIFLFASCNKERHEDEIRQIETYIADNLGVKFMISDNDLYYYELSTGEGESISEGDEITVVYSGYNLDEMSNNIPKEFAENDTFSFVVGDKNVMNGWNEATKIFRKGGAGILIFPYYIAHGSKQVGVIPPYSTLLFKFRIEADDDFAEQTSLFHDYILRLDSLPQKTDNGVFYYTYFHGVGSKTLNGQTAKLNFNLSLINQTKIDTVANSEFVVGTSLPSGLSEVLPLLNEGSMAKVFIPPRYANLSQTYTNVPENSGIVYELQIASDNPDVMENSEIQKFKFFYLQESEKADTTLANGTLFFKTKDNETGDEIYYNDLVRIVYTEQILNQADTIFACDTCELNVNSTNFNSGLLSGLLLMKKGEKAKLVVPYSAGYGNTGNGDIPPFSPLFYKVEILE